MNGVLLVDKPSGITSHDVVDHVRRAAGMRRIGHTGTLDPAATGLLVLCLGAATRLSEHLTGLDKIYEGVMRLGIVTDSYDLDGEVLEQRDPPDLLIETIRETCGRFVGQIEQVPPMVSAVKVGGERLYKRARKGEVVERPARTVTIHEFAALEYERPDVSIRVWCSSGTYVRSLCHEVGSLLGCGAALARLRRTAVGRYRIDGAVSPDVLRNAEEVERHLMPLDSALDLPSVTLRPTSRRTVVAGGALGAGDIVGTCPVGEGWVQIKSRSGKLLALGTVQGGTEHPRIHPKRVFV